MTKAKTGEAHKGTFDGEEVPVATRQRSPRDKAYDNLVIAEKKEPDRGIYETTFTVTVYSRGRFVSGPFDLAAINYAITEGDCIGMVERTAEYHVPAAYVERKLIEIGNDGTFFEEET